MIGHRRYSRLTATEADPPTEPGTPAPTEPAEPPTPEQIEQILETAIKDGKIDAETIDLWRRLFEVDHIGTEQTIENLPPGRFDNTIANILRR